MITVFVHQAGSKRTVDRVDPAWLAPDSGIIIWVDLSKPDAGDVRMLSEVFHFHPLSIQDALSAVHHPKIEACGDGGRDGDVVCQAPVAVS